MAFVSMILVFVVFILAVLAFMAILGLILLIIGLVKAKKYKGQGKKYPKVLIVLGSISLGIPVAIIGFVVISSIISDIRLDMERKNYTNFLDKWKNENEWVSDSEAEQDVLDGIFEAVEKNDADAIRGMFQEKLQRFIDEENMERFLDEFPKDIEGYKLKDKGGSGSSSSEYGVSTKSLNAHYEMEVNGTYYYIFFGACYDCDEDTSKVGLEYFYIESEKAQAMDIERRDDEYLVADIDVAEAFEVRRIWGNPRRFTQIDRTLTQEQVLETLQTVKTVDEFIAIYGEPNAEYEYMKDLYYELEENNGEDWYLSLSYYQDEIQLSSTFFTNSDGDNTIWLDEDGNIKAEDE